MSGRSRFSREGREGREGPGFEPVRLCMRPWFRVSDRFNHGLHEYTDSTPPAESFSGPSGVRARDRASFAFLRLSVKHRPVTFERLKLPRQKPKVLIPNPRQISALS